METIRRIARSTAGLIKRSKLTLSRTLRWWEKKLARALPFGQFARKSNDGKNRGERCARRRAALPAQMKKLCEIVPRVTSTHRIRLFGINGRYTSRVLIQLLFAASAAMVLLVAMPSLASIPGIDSGIFLHAAQHIMHGEVPYRDFWENKPPGIYYVDAFGLWLGHGSRWGVWVVEWISLWAAASFGFTAMRRAFGDAPALFAIVCWLFGFARVLQGGNFTEEFVPPLQFASVLAFERLEGSGSRLIDAALVGAFGAMAFLLKPNAIGLWLGIGMVMVGRSIRYRTWRSLLELGKGATLGASALLVPVIMYFYFTHSLDRLYDQAFRFNVIYSASSTLSARLRCVYSQFGYMASSGLSVVVLAGWILGIYVLLHAKTSLSETAGKLLLLSIIALPLETILAATTGDIYFHHFIIPLTTWAILLGFAAWFASNSVTLSTRAFHIPIRRYSLNVGLASLVFMAWLAAARTTISTLRMRDDTPYLAAQYVLRNSSRSDYVLTWGLSARIDFTARRPEPSRYFHEFPLSTRGYVNPLTVQSFLADLNQHSPLLIIDSSADSGRLPPLSEEERRMWVKDSTDPWRAQLADMMSPFFRYVQLSYRFSAALGSARWKVYRRIN